MIMLRSFFLALTSFFLLQTSFATHLQGGELSLTHIQGDSFRIEYRQFRDCSAINAPNVVNLTRQSSCSPTSTISLNLIASSTLGLNTMCTSNISNSYCNGGSFPGMQLSIYADTIVLTNCSSWNFSTSYCCRPMSNNVQSSSSGIFVDADFDISNHNSSPRLSNSFFHLLNSADTLVLDYSAIDVDGDSLTYAFDGLKTSSSSNASYNPGYSASNPIPGMSINAATGMVTYQNASPISIGNYFFGIRVNEYDRNTGALKSSILKECSAMVLSPSASTNTFNDFAAISSPFNGQGVSSINGDTVFVHQGDTAQFDVSSSHLISQSYLITNVAYTYTGASSTLSLGNTSTLSFVVPTNGLKQGVHAMAIESMLDTCGFTRSHSKGIFLSVLPANQNQADLTLCAGDTFQFTPSISGSFVWSSTNGSLVPGQNIACTNCSNPWISPSATTTYMVQITGANNLVSNDTFTIFVDQAIGFAYFGNAVICDGDSVALTVSNTSSFSIVGSDGTSCNNCTNAFFNPSQYTTIYTLVDSSVNICPTPSPITITMEQRTQTIADESICLGDSVVLSSTGLGLSWVPQSSLSCTNCDSPTATPTQTTTYVVTGSQTACNATDSVTIQVDSGYVYKGSVSDASGSPINGLVYLISYNALDSTVSILDSTTTQMGNYYFYSQEATVFIKAIPDSANHPNAIPTYFTNAATFLSSTEVQGSLCDSVSSNIQVLAGTNPGGQGFIAGNVFQGAGKVSGGNAVQGLDLLLMNANNEVVEHLTTDVQGAFKFNNLSNGDYSIYVDHPKFFNQAPPVISIDDSNMEQNLTLFVEKNELVVDQPSTSIAANRIAQVNLYPNPTQGIITIQVVDYFTFSLVDLSGKVLVEKQESHTQAQLNLSDFPKGMYLLQIYKKGYTSRYPIMKN